MKFDINGTPCMGGLSSFYSSFVIMNRSSVLLFICINYYEYFLIIVKYSGALEVCRLQSLPGKVPSVLSHHRNLIRCKRASE